MGIDTARLGPERERSDDHLLLAWGGGPQLVGRWMTSAALDDHVIVEVQRHRAAA
jgi:hypothetical protein